MSKRYPHWEVRWNRAGTIGLVWRIRDWGGMPPAPVVEAVMRRGGAKLTLADAKAEAAHWPSLHNPGARRTTWEREETTDHCRTSTK